MSPIEMDFKNPGYQRILRIRFLRILKIRFLMILKIRVLTWVQIILMIDILENRMRGDYNSRDNMWNAQNTCK